MSWGMCVLKVWRDVFWWGKRMGGNDVREFGANVSYRAFSWSAVRRAIFEFFYVKILICAFNPNI